VFLVSGQLIDFIIIMTYCGVGPERTKALWVTVKMTKKNSMMLVLKIT
jgi:hypothetical protein